MHVDIRATYVAQTYLPLVHNFSPYAEQQPNIGYFTKLYRGISPKLYGFLRHPIIVLSTYSCTYMRLLRKPTSLSLVPPSLENRSL